MCPNSQVFCPQLTLPCKNCYSLQVWVKVNFTNAVTTQLASTIASIRCNNYSLKQWPIHHTKQFADLTMNSYI